MTEQSQAAQFAVVLRGYDRTQVDDYVREAAARLEQAQSRALSAERETVAARGGSSPAPRQAGFAELGAEVTAVLQSAEEAARRIRAEADAYADRVRSDTERYAERTRAQAESSARDSLESAAAQAAKSQAAAVAAQDQEQRILADARTRVSELLEAAQQRADQKAEETVAAAAQEREQLLAGAQQQAEMLVSKASRRTSELDAAVRQLEERRQRTATEVQHLARQLHEVAEELAGRGLVDDSPTVEVRRPVVVEHSAS